MQIVQQVVPPSGATSSAIISTVRKEGEFAVFVSLEEGTNNFIATATDGAGHTTTEPLSVIVDLTGPSASSVTFPAADTYYAPSTVPSAFTGDTADNVSGLSAAILVIHLLSPYP